MQNKIERELIVGLSPNEMEEVSGGAILLVLIPLAKGFVAGAGTVAAGAAILDAAGVADFW